MAKIQVKKNNKTGQIKYELILPKEIMDNLVVQKGDSLILKSVVGDEITFKHIRLDRSKAEKLYS